MQQGRFQSRSHKRANSINVSTAQVLFALWSGLVVFSGTAGTSLADGIRNESIWSEKVARALNRPPVILGDDVVWVGKPRGGIEARSLKNGERLYRFGGRRDLSLRPVGKTTLLGIRERPEADSFALFMTPPGLLTEVSLDRRVIDIDVCGETVAVLLSGPELRLFENGEPVQLGPLRLPGPGWSKLQILDDGENTHIFVSKRDGYAILYTPRGEVHPLPNLLGGLVEVIAHKDNTILVGEEGSVIGLGSEFEVLWKVELGSGLQSLPLVVDGRVWLPLKDRRLVVFDPERHEVVGHIALSVPLSAPLIEVQGCVAWCDFEGNVNAVDSSTFLSVWSMEFKTTPVGAAASRNRLTVAFEDGRLSCFDLTEREY